MDGDSLLLGLTDAEGDTEGDSLLLGLMLALGETDGDDELDGLTLGETLTETELEGLPAVIAGQNSNRFTSSSSKKVNSRPRKSDGPAISGGSEAPVAIVPLTVKWFPLPLTSSPAFAAMSIG